MTKKQMIDKANRLASKHGRTVIVVIDYCAPDKPYVFCSEDSFDDNGFESDDIVYTAEPR